MDIKYLFLIEISSEITVFTKPEHVTQKAAEYLAASETPSRCKNIQRNFIEMLYYLLGPLAPIEPLGYNSMTMEPIFKYKYNRIRFVTPESKAIIAKVYNNFEAHCKTVTPNRFGKLQTAYSHFLAAVAARGGGGSASRRSTRRKQRKQRKTRRH